MTPDPNELVCTKCGQSPKYTYEGDSTCCHARTTRRWLYDQEREWQAQEQIRQDEQAYLHEYQLYGGYEHKQPL